VSVDSFAAAAHFAEHLELKFPLLGDWPRYEAGRLYGVYQEEKGYHARTTFVIDADGIIRAVIDVRDPGAHAPRALDAVRALCTP